MSLADQEGVQSVGDAADLYRFVTEVPQYQVQSPQLLVFPVGLHAELTRQPGLHCSTEPEISAGEF